MKHQSDLPLWNLKDKTVLVRADLNVPRTKDGTIRNDFRLKKSLPTLELIKSKGGTTVLLTHCGRPQHKEPELSTELFVDWFKQRNFNPIFCRNFEELHREIRTQKHNLIIFENLRFFEGEKKNSSEFAQQLFEGADYFVQDASAALHREHASLIALPQLFESHKKTVGLLVEKELHVLDELLHHSEKPFVAILGGNKIATKIPLIETLLEKIDVLLLCPALVFTFLKAQNHPIGNSLVDETQLKHVKHILKKAEEKQVDIIFPLDYMVTKNSFEQAYPLHTVERIAPGMTGISIGQKTAQLFKQYILKADTVFLNGINGNPDYPESLEGMKTIFNALEQSAAHKIITGGDSLALAQSLGHSEQMGTFLTGGGASLTYLSGSPLASLLALS